MSVVPWSKQASAMPEAVNAELSGADASIRRHGQSIAYEDSASQHHYRRPAERRNSRSPALTSFVSGRSRRLVPHTARPSNARIPDRVYKRCHNASLAVTNEAYERLPSLDLAMAATAPVHVPHAKGAVGSSIFSSRSIPKPHVYSSLERQTAVPEQMSL